MNKAVLYNLQDRFAIHEILSSKTFEPEFRNWSDDELSSLVECDLVVYYSPVLDLEQIKKIRDAMHFMNIKLIIYCDEIDVKTKKEAQLYGADMAELLPDSEEELISHMKKSYFRLRDSISIPTEKLAPFKSAIMEIFSTMALMNVEIIQEYLNTSKFHFSDYSGIMALAGNTKGAIMLSLSEPLAKKMIGNILAIPEEEMIDEDVHDGVGELINMIAGGAKARISDDNELFLLSAPTVITGHKHRVIQQKDMPCVVLVFKADDFYFAVQICMMALEKE